MKELKWIIIALVILIVILTVILFINLNINNDNSSNANSINITQENEIENSFESTEELGIVSPEDDTLNIDNTKNVVQLVTERNIYYTIEGIVEKYIEMIKYNNIDVLINSLDTNYIKSYSITKGNIKNKIPTSYWGIEKYNVKLVIDNMYYVETSENITVYFIYGKTRNAKTKKTEPFNLMLEVDSINSTYAILPTNYIKDNKYENLQISQKFYSNLEYIEKNDYNEYNLTVIDDKILVRDYLYKYRDLVTYEKENAYKLLNKSYREKRFGSLNNYLNYIKEDKKLAAAIIQKYKKTEYDNYTEYDCIDKNGRHYIFRETAVMQYTLLLDDYTIETEEYKKEYADASDEGKVNTNINKFIKMLNNGDYKQSYAVLNNTFKSKNFNSQDKFKNYIKSKVFDVNNVDFADYTINGDNHISQIKLSDATGKSKQTVTMIIIMKLKEGTNFEISFNFK